MPCLTSPLPIKLFFALQNAPTVSVSGRILEKFPILLYYKKARMQGFFGNISIFGNPHKYFFPLSTYRTKDKPAVGGTRRAAFPRLLCLQGAARSGSCGGAAAHKKSPALRLAARGT
ncbi:MAG: hypothetical protein IJC29_04625 [Clostridia bacterium]|nr:hypothetical protein [Clostridia bacterium]